MLSCYPLQLAAVRDARCAVRAERAPARRSPIPPSFASTMPVRLVFASTFWTTHTPYAPVDTVAARSPRRRQPPYRVGAPEFSCARRGRLVTRLDRFPAPAGLVVRRAVSAPRRLPRLRHGHSSITVSMTESPGIQAVWRAEHRGTRGFLIPRSEPPAVLTCIERRAGRRRGHSTAIIRTVHARDRRARPRQPGGRWGEGPEPTSEIGGSVTCPGLSLTFPPKSTMPQN